MISYGHQLRSCSFLQSPALSRTALFRPRHFPRSPAIVMSQVPSPSPNTTRTTPLGSDRARHGLDETPHLVARRGLRILSFCSDRSSIESIRSGPQGSYISVTLLAPRHEPMVRSLGAGLPTCSTHLLCYRDTAAHDRTYVAVKILTAHATACIVGGLSHECDVFRRIESANRSHPGFPHCLALRHYFTAYSSVGGHICFVTDVLGSNLQSLRVAQPNQTFSLNIAKRIVKQILLGLDYLHRECGYVHTG
jgi:hypothetical protein